jgi:hypothetical protein
MNTPSPLIVTEPYEGLPETEARIYDAGSTFCVAHVSSKADANLLAAAYNAFDKAGRELGVDAATLAAQIDIAAILTALREMVIANHGLPMRPTDEADPVCRVALECAQAALATVPTL